MELKTREEIIIMHIDFVGKRKIFYILTSIVIVLGVISFFMKGFVQDIEFSGGTIIEINIGQAFENNDIEKIVADIVGGTPIIQKMGNEEELQTRVSISTGAMEEDQRDQVLTAIAQRYQIQNINEASTFRTVRPSFGDEMRSRAWQAILWSTVFIAIYIAIVFKSISGFSAGLSASIALLHDLIIMLVVYSIFSIPLNTTFIAAILTILGYSINDTVIVYDRIRENQLKNRKMHRDELVNLSINETMRRTLFTSVSVIFALIVLYCFGVYYKVASIKEFSFPLIIGMISGTYSSIFIAGNLWVSWNKFVEARKARKPKKS